MIGQDWETVTLHKKTAKPKTAKAKANTAQQALLSGNAQVETVKKFNAGSNKTGKSAPAVNARKLDADDEERTMSVPTVSHNVALAIQQGRQGMNPPWTQKQLAMAISEPAQTINDYESGRAIPNQQILSKIERALGVRVRGKK
eukprot:gnl/Hemi2/3673_TR1284_c0_g1_i1.p1 gnl/Hemi2/3673_TR1284_c0_g1~~gnl/Hemi2/3673_TR1284_c0_g1_i1.p1  ORF type:complete len:144 (+),score=35.15 gnl/Hemi2/3673_TR1284_c0_g1_i1:96-527(+)